PPEPATAGPPSSGPRSARAAARSGPIAPRPATAGSARARPAASPPTAGPVAPRAGPVWTAIRPTATPALGAGAQAEAPQWLDPPPEPDAARGQRYPLTHHRPTGPATGRRRRYLPLPEPEMADANQADTRRPGPDHQPRRDGARDDGPDRPGHRRPWRHA